MFTQALIISEQFGDFYFDAVFETEHAYEVMLTDFPVQGGESITDHSVYQPEHIKMSVGFSDVMQSTDDPNHSVTAFQLLKAIMQYREPVNLVTRLESYSDMVITALSTVDTYETQSGLKVDVELKQVRIVDVSTVNVIKSTTSYKKKTQKPKSDSEDVADAGNQSMLYSLTNGDISQAWQELVNPIERNVNEILGG